MSRRDEVARKGLALNACRLGHESMGVLDSTETRRCAQISVRADVELEQPVLKAFGQVELP